MALNVRTAALSSVAALFLAPCAVQAAIFTYTLEFSGSGTKQEIFQPGDRMVNSTLNAATIRFQLSDADMQSSISGTANGNGIFQLRASSTGFGIDLGSTGGFLRGSGTINFNNSSGLLPGAPPTPVSGDISFFTFESGNETSQSFSGRLTSFVISQTSGSSNNFASISTTVGPVAVIPEASTWAMMLVGFGLIGATTRYRRRDTTVRYA